MSDIDPSEIKPHLIERLAPRWSLATLAYIEELEQRVADLLSGLDEANKRWTDTREELEQQLDAAQVELEAREPHWTVFESLEAELAAAKADAERLQKRFGLLDENLWVFGSDVIPVIQDCGGIENYLDKLCRARTTEGEG